MIASIKHGALKRYWTKGDKARLNPDWRDKIIRLLDALNAARQPSDMDALGFGFHALTGDRNGTFAVWASRNWRITFGWDGDDAIDVNLEDYHG